MCLFSLIKYINATMLFMSFIHFIYIVILLKNYSKKYKKQRTKDVITEYCLYFVLNEIFINLLSSGWFSYCCYLLLFIVKLTFMKPQYKLQWLHNNPINHVDTKLNFNTYHSITYQNEILYALKWIVLPWYYETIKMYAMSDVSLC